MRSRPGIWPRNGLCKGHEKNMQPEPQGFSGVLCLGTWTCGPFLSRVSEVPELFLQACDPHLCPACWVGGQSPTTPTSSASFSSCSQFMKSSFIMGQPCTDPSYGPAATAPSFPPKSSDFPQVGDLGWAVHLLEV